MNSYLFPKEDLLFLDCLHLFTPSCKNHLKGHLPHWLRYHLEYPEPTLQCLGLSLLLIRETQAWDLSFPHHVSPATQQMMAQVISSLTPAQEMQIEHLALTLGSKSEYLLSVFSSQLNTYIFNFKNIMHFYWKGRVQILVEWGPG